MPGVSKCLTRADLLEGDQVYFTQKLDDPGLVDVHFNALLRERGDCGAN
jgi:hypothetical protein